MQELEHDSRHLFAQWSQGSATFSTDEVISLRRRYNQAYREAGRIAEAAILSKLRDQFTDQGLCWKVLNSIRNPDPTVAIDVGTLVNHFTRVFHRRDRPINIHLGPGEQWVSDLETGWQDEGLNEPFGDDELVAALRGLNAQAATGPELIPSSVLKDVFLGDSVARVPLLLLMNTCFQSGTVPASWGVSELFILYKGKGLRTKPDNYRAIALSNDFRRLYERLLIARLNRWSSEHTATGRMQFGFKKGTGTTEAIFVLRTFLLYSTRLLKKPAYACFVDLEKAFPSTSQMKIIEVLRKSKAPWKLTRALASLMSCSSSTLRVNGRVTPPFLVTSGTPEGSILSPEAFSILFKAVLDELGIHELPDDLSKIDPMRVYYIAFADDLALFSLDLKALGRVATEFKVTSVKYDLHVSDEKTKWVAFLPPVEAEGFELRKEDLRLVMDGKEVELVEEFHYLGYRLDCNLTDVAHEDLINGRYLRAARAVGKLMKDMRCTNPVTLRKFFLSLVFSQFYGVIFVSGQRLEFARGVGIFIKTSLGLPDSFPSVVAMAILGVKDLSMFVFEQRSKFFLKVEGKTDSPAFAALMLDRCTLFPAGHGLNSLYGDVLVQNDVLRTMDYRAHFQGMPAGLQARLAGSHAAAMLGSDGRLFWDEAFPTCFLPEGLKIVIGNLTGECARTFVLFLSDMLRWTAVKTVRKPCQSCKSQFTTGHFLSCNRFFLSGLEYRTFLSLAKAEAWENLVNFIFDVLHRWVTDTDLFKDFFRLSVLEYVPFDVDRDLFRWSL